VLRVREVSALNAPSRREGAVVRMCVVLLLLLGGQVREPATAPAGLLPGARRTELVDQWHRDVSEATATVVTASFVDGMI
jgi:hypothetical protein